MVNPNIAIHSIRNIHKEMKELEETWNRFVFEKREPQRMRMPVYQSWKRLPILLTRILSNAKMCICKLELRCQHCRDKISIVRFKDRI